ncbi:MAG: heme-binding protein [Ilumatobacteraceae bacterium]
MSDSGAITSRSTLTFAGARRVLDAALAEAQRLGIAVCVDVVDDAGWPILTARMDGAPRLSARIAADKAFSVASFNGVPTDRWWGMIEHDPALVHGITKTERLAIFGGGVPVIVDGAIVGAVGVSGGSAEQDVEVATAGAAALAV